MVTAVSLPAPFQLPAAALCVPGAAPIANGLGTIDVIDAVDVIDIAAIRHLFPVLTANPDKIFFDNAATTHKPIAVIDVINEFNSARCANAGRGSYSWSTRLSGLVEESREAVAALLNSDPSLVAFTNGATDSLNLIAVNWGMENLSDGDEVMVCPDDHQSSVLPWFNLKRVLERFGISITIVPFTIHSTGTYDRKSIANGLSDRTRLISVSQVHHLYGMEMDLPEVCELIPNEVLISLDASQSIGHFALDVEHLGVDFISFSGHKMFASNGIGGLWTSPRALQRLWPMRVGAKTALERTAAGLRLDRSCLAYVIECGTLNLPGIFSLGTAARFMQALDMRKVESYVSELTKYLVAKLKTVPSIEFAPGIGVCECTRGYGIASFRIEGLSSGDIGAFLDSEGVFVRTGDHCLGLGRGTSEYVRVSLQVYNTFEEVDRFVEVLVDACG